MTRSTAELDRTLRGPNQNQPIGRSALFCRIMLRSSCRRRFKRTACTGDRLGEIFRHVRPFSDFDRQFSTSMFSSPEAASPDSDSTLIPRKRQKVCARPVVQQVAANEKWGNGSGNGAVNGTAEGGKRTGRTRPPLSCGECRRQV